MSEMSAWLDLQIAKGGDNALGEYRQLQLVRCGSVSIATGIIFKEFLGDVSQFYKQTRQEFFEMTVCSLNKEDIDFHYRRMSFRYHALGGVNDETLRQVYLNSLPSELQGELQRLIEFSGKTLREITLGEIHMFTHTALEKLCATQRVFSKMLKEGKRQRQAKKRAEPEKIFRSQKIQILQEEAKKILEQVEQVLRLWSRRAFCKTMPKQKNKICEAHQATQASSRGIPSDADVESYFSEENDVSKLTTFMMLDSDITSPSEDSDDNSSQHDYPSEVYQATSGETTSPQVKIQVMSSKYSKPVPVIAYFDTGAHSSMMNPNVLPPDA
ncbi:hypothetical protein Ddye_021509 [Dipteronia dyeriana]|uniref:Uncharacterized protein n=1 Tax=Dipteronia dyeriana TaxID=168575 RepID=A0AAD9U1S4_9ROSI|nr:hypothetical protein Ddye_021509 [Dipteronia dyeriana]